MDYKILGHEPTQLLINTFNSHFRCNGRARMLRDEYESSNANYRHNNQIRLFETHIKARILWQMLESMINRDIHKRLKNIFVYLLIKIFFIETFF